MLAAIIGFVLGGIFTFALLGAVLAVKEDDAIKSKKIQIGNKFYRLTEIE